MGLSLVLVEHIEKRPKTNNNNNKKKGGSKPKGLYSHLHVTLQKFRHLDKGFASSLLLLTETETLSSAQGLNFT